MTIWCYIGVAAILLAAFMVGWVIGDCIVYYVRRNFK